MRSHETMKLLSRQTIQASDGKSSPLCALVTYIDNKTPVLLCRTGLEVGDDVHDHFCDSISADNGRTWSEPRPQPFWSARREGDRYLVHTENAALFLPDEDTLFHFTNDRLEKDLGQCDLGAPSRLRVTSGAPEAVAAGRARAWTGDFGKPQGVAMSFCNPVQDARGRVLLPVQWQMADEDGALRAQGFEPRPGMPHFLRDFWEVGLVIGEEGDDGEYDWRLAGAVPFDVATTTRGLCEGTFTELKDGRLAMILRGSNSMRHTLLPGYKWLSFSEDGGESWSLAQPLTYDDGAPVESGATGSALFRSQRNGRLYWMGNPCDEGTHAVANWPRTPLVLAEVREEPFALVRDSLFVIDRAPDDNPYVQHSNFKYYQDRETGDVVVYLTRYGERGTEGTAWLDADLYEYRIGLDT
jgi:hypothetical protein